MNKLNLLLLTNTQLRQTTVNEHAYGAERIHALVRLAKNWLYPLYDAQSSVHFEQRGAGRSPTTLTLSMLHARTRLLLAFSAKEKASQLSLVRRPSLTMGVYMTGDLS
jgi:hypothetical protein